MFERKGRVLPLIAVMVIAAYLVLPVDLSGQTRYTITDLGFLGAGSNFFSFAFPEGINDRGQVVGFSTAPNTSDFHAFLWQDGVMTDLGSLGFGQWVFINNGGEIVLDPADANFNPQAELLEGGQATLLPGLGGSFTLGAAIANSGEIVGTASLADGVTFLGVIWKGGQISQLGPNTIGGVNSAGIALNAAGVPAGTGDVATIDPFFGFPDFHAVIWDKGTMRDIGLLGGFLSLATGINDQGQVVGLSDIDALDPTFGVPLLHAFLWQNGKLADLGTTAPGSNMVSAAQGINDRGQIVGNLGQMGPCICYDDTGAFLWQNGVMTDLNTLLPPGSPFAQLTVAWAINRLGQIVGIGNMFDGSPHPFLLSPVPAGSTPSMPPPANAGPAGVAPAPPQHTIRHVLTRTGVKIEIH